MTEALDDINRTIARLLRLNASRSAFARSTEAAGVPLSYPTYLLLRTTTDHGPIAMSQLAERVNMDPGMAARQVTKLVESGFVERHPDPTDGRVSLIAATRAGRRAGNAITKVRSRHLSASVAGWSDRDLSTFARLLDRFVDDMATTDYEGARQ